MEVETNEERTVQSAVVEKETPEDTLAALRAEAEALRAELSTERRLSAELREFCALYPETPAETIPDEIWIQVKAGIPLAAAYALHERRQVREREAAETAHQQGRARSSGALEGNAGEMPYTPDEVRAMSPAEVRRNYAAIMASMKRW